MEGIQCPRNDIQNSNDKKEKKIFNETILKEYKVIRQSFNPNDKSPNLFNKRLQLRMKSYYDLLNKKN